MRTDGRRDKELRKTTIERNVLDHAEGSCLISTGKTKVLCAASVETDVPRWLKGSDRGWVTAEYSMLPRSTHDRSRRERGGKLGGRTMEIQRLIGRSLRSVTDLKKMPGIQIIVDCDVLQADGGTRTASITGAFVALVDALRWAKKKGLIKSVPLTDYIAAVSVGKVGDKLLLDLKYDEDSNAEVDANFVLTGRGQIVEIQGTAEGDPFSEDEFMKLFRLAKTGIRKLVTEQKKVISPALTFPRRK